MQTWMTSCTQKRLDDADVWDADVVLPAPRLQKSRKKVAAAITTSAIASSAISLLYLHIVRQRTTTDVVRRHTAMPSGWRTTSCGVWTGLKSAKITNKWLPTSTSPNDYQIFSTFTITITLYIQGLKKLSNFKARPKVSKIYWLFEHRMCNG